MAKQEIIQEIILFNMWVVEYSKSQNAFHVCTAKERKQLELDIKFNGKKSDYEVIARYMKRDDADAFVNRNYDLVKNCRMYKNENGEIFVL